MSQSSSLFQLQSSRFPLQSFVSARSSFESSAGAFNDSFRFSEDDVTDTSYPNVSQLCDDVFLPPKQSPKPEALTRTPAVKRAIEEVL